MLQFYPTKITSSRAASRRPLKGKGRFEKTHTITSTNVLLTTRLAKVRKKDKSYNTDKLPQHDCKNEIPENDKNEAAYQMLRMLTKVWGSGNGEKTTDTDKPT